VHPVTIHRKLAEWQKMLDKRILDIKKEWERGGCQKYQLVGDNWDKNILPSYRTSDRETVSLHLFNIYAIVDRIQPDYDGMDFIPDDEIEILQFLPSVEEQQLLRKELTFLISTSVINCHPQLQKQFSKIYPKHLEHKYSRYAGIKTMQVCTCIFWENSQIIQGLHYYNLQLMDK